MKADLAFHSVGQGLFHSGIITKGANATFQKFSFVYDCGGNFSEGSPGKREVDLFKPRLKHITKPRSKGKLFYLNLLIISHFHDDHVNGLEHLLDQVEVGLAVIPYVTEEELILAASTADNLSAFQLEFYKNPVKKLKEAGVHQVIMTSGNDNLFGQDVPDNASRSNLDSETIIDEMRADGIDFPDYASTTKVLMKKGFEAPLLGPSFRLKTTHLQWEFLFYNHPIDRDVLKSFTQELDSIKAYTGHDGIAELVATREVRALIRKAYDDLMNKIKSKHDLNQTSTVVYHSPILEDMMHEANLLYLSLPQVYYADKCAVCYADKCATLLTGDINCPSGSSLGIIDSKRTMKKSQVAVLQVPHHGSKKNLAYDWKANYQPELAVISYGIGNRYSHPDYDAISHYGCFRKDFCRTGVFLINDQNNFHYLIITPDS